MDDTQKMLKAIINGQSALKEDLIKRIEKLDIKVDGLQEETRNGFKKVNARIDRIGKTLALLEDDAPTREEFEDLEKRVERIEKDASN